jgi:hypothetical protein
MPTNLKISVSSSFICKCTELSIPCLQWNGESSTCGWRDGLQTQSAAATTLSGQQQTRSMVHQHGNKLFTIRVFLCYKREEWVSD